MKKGKLNTADGSEFTVFYLKGESENLADYHDPDHPLNKHDEGQMYNMNEQDVNENSAGGGMHAAFAAEGGWPPTGKDYAFKSFGDWSPQSKINKDKKFNKNKKGFIDKILDEIAKLNEPRAESDEGLPLIDDVIESDIVSNPIFNHIYKIKTLNKLAMFKGHSIVEGVHSIRWYSMDYHGLRFHVPEDSLLRVRELEANKYFNK